LLSRNIKPGVVFQLRQGDVSLLCEVHPLPHFNISEEVIDPRCNKFLLKMNPETPV
jgi:vang-like